MTHDGQVFSMEQHTNLYFHHVEVINDLVESFQMYATHMYPLDALVTDSPHWVKKINK